MPSRDKPLKAQPDVGKEKTSERNPMEKHDKQNEEDESLPLKGRTQNGLNEESRGDTREDK